MSGPRFCALHVLSTQHPTFLGALTNGRPGGEKRTWVGSSPRKPSEKKTQPRRPPVSLPARRPHLGGVPCDVRCDSPCDLPCNHKRQPQLRLSTARKRETRGLAPHLVRRAIPLRRALVTSRGANLAGRGPRFSLRFDLECPRRADSSPTHLAVKSGYLRISNRRMMSK